MEVAEDTKRMGMTRTEKELKMRINAGLSNKENTSPKYSMNHKVMHQMIMANPSASHTTSKAFAQPIVLRHTRFHLKPKKRWKNLPKPAELKQKQRKR